MLRERELVREGLLRLRWAEVAGLAEERVSRKRSARRQRVRSGLWLRAIRFPVIAFGTVRRGFAARIPVGKIEAMVGAPAGCVNRA